MIRTIEEVRVGHIYRDDSTNVIYKVVGFVKTIEEDIVSVETTRTNRKGEDITSDTTKWPTSVFLKYMEPIKDVNNNIKDEEVEKEEPSLSTSTISMARKQLRFEKIHIEGQMEELEKKMTRMATHLENCKKKLVGINDSLEELDEVYRDMLSENLTNGLSYLRRRKNNE